MPRLSVIMPARNAGATVESAVRSTLHDLPADAELVVGDDASTDGMRYVLDRIEDSRLRVIDCPGRGLARALNTLLDATDSPLVARMDADDIVIRGRFRRQVRALATADTVFTTVTTWRGSGMPRPACPVAIGEGAFGFHLLLTNPVAHSTMAARRTAIDEAGGYRDVPSEDYDLWLRMQSRGAGMRRLAAPGIVYRVHARQVTATDGWRLSSWQDESTQHAFADLSERLLGAPQMRISALAIAPFSRGEKLARMAEFDRSFRAAVRLVPLPARTALLRRLAARSEWLWQRSDTAPGMIGAAT
ncbi:glycosyltransferase family 2 protein [Microbacterium gubbeenense]|uniref:glycosyltransferase family 2 protein n=1 Tax=Microbacterium gubbeenense TaxID=159896 RepID=UPI003F9BBF63